MKELKETLKNYKVTELKEIAKNSGIKGYSKLKKDELIDIIIDNITDKDISKIDLPEDIKNVINNNTKNTAVDNFSDAVNDNEKEENIIKLKNRLFGVAPLVANVIPEDMPVPPSKTPDSFMQIKKVYPNDKCPCGSGKKYKKCCGRAV